MVLVNSQSCATTITNSFRTLITPERNSTHKQSFLIYKLTSPKFISPACISLYWHIQLLGYLIGKTNLTYLKNEPLNSPYKTYFSHNIHTSHKNFTHLVAQTKNLRIFPAFFFLTHCSFNHSIIFLAKPSKYI